MGLYYPIVTIEEMQSLLEIPQQSMPTVFSHIAKFGESGRMFGNILRPDAEQLIEAQRKLDLERLRLATEYANRSWLEAKISAARKKLDLDLLG